MNSFEDNVDLLDRKARREIKEAKSEGWMGVDVLVEKVGPGVYEKIMIGLRDDGYKARSHRNSYSGRLFVRVDWGKTWWEKIKGWWK